MSLALALWPAGGSERALWQIVLIAGGAIAGVAFAFTGLLLFALTDAADQDVFSDAGLQALNVLSSDSWVASNAALGVMMLGAAGSLFARRASKALAWIALVCSIASFIPFADFAALIISGLWIIWVSVQLYRRGAAFALAIA